MICGWHSSDTDSTPSKTVSEENSVYTIPYQSEKGNIEHSPPNNCVLRQFDSNGHKTDRPKATKKVQQKNQCLSLTFYCSPIYSQKSPSNKLLQSVQ